MHPAHSAGFDWTDANVEHLARHHIRAWEVEQVFLDGPRLVPNKKGATGAWQR